MRSIYILLTLLFLASSCGSSTSMTESWTNKDALGQGPYNSVFIIAMTGNMVAKALIEDELAFYANKRGVQAIKAHDVFPATFSEGNRPDKATIMKLIRDTGADAILTVTLLDKETESRYVPGNTNYAYGYRPMAYSYYGNFYGYYRTLYPVAYDPGYYTTDKIYYMETNVYNAETEELLWSGQSKTYNPSSLESFTQDYTEALIKRLDKDKLIDEQ
ncbi:hypothetical protein [Robertkochia sediminum]|uniref:hypothetical protein n=1 Tax=Robertkochia sediminum TaxID=2785326 RepID=UPI0019345D3B|nr:hypothetical protein [Robertkochia sediminum]MBL7472306.1 hypothetical protein [Robertkochia sediminum]